MHPSNIIMTIIWILIAIAALIAAVFLIKLPSHISRSVIIEKPIDDVFKTVLDFNQWTVWSPWLIMEPDATVTVSRDGTSVSSVYSWDGKKVGAGEIEHKTIELNKLIDQEIRFLRPMKSVARVYFRFEEVDGGTKVSWNMDSKQPLFMLPMKAMFEAWIGYDYERGLAMLKSYIETGTVESILDVQEVVDMPEQRYIAIRKPCTFETVGPSMMEAYGTLKSVMEEKGITPSNEWFAVYHKWDMKTREGEYSAAVAVADDVDVTEGEVFTGVRPACKAYKVVHTGAYTFLANAWMTAYSFVYNDKSLKKSKQPGFEIYVSDPEATAPKDIVTEVYVPVK